MRTPAALLCLTLAACQRPAPPAAPPPAPPVQTPAPPAAVAAAKEPEKPLPVTVEWLYGKCRSDPVYAQKELIGKRLILTGMVDTCDKSGCLLSTKQSIEGFRSGDCVRCKGTGFAGLERMSTIKVECALEDFGGGVPTVTDCKILK